MSIQEWAEREVNSEIAKCEDGYTVEGLKSALKAYKSLCEDGHSGMSFSITRHFLTKLMNSQPLSPIVDEDFFSEVAKDSIGQTKEYLKERGLKSDIQCPRMSSLFREETLEGIVSYHDIDRAYCINVENERNTFSCWLTQIIDEKFPITMPYSPKLSKYKIYVYEFLCDKSNGAYDHQGIQKIVTPEGETIEIDDWFFKEGEDQWIKQTKEEFFRDMETRIDL